MMKTAYITPEMKLRALSSEVVMESASSDIPDNSETEPGHEITTNGKELIDDEMPSFNVWDD
ncbi:MAG: hypothetical protein IJM81_08530 [Prevotella sp.]|nr:hypothetical protein [Prevotella sp.]